MFQMLVSKLGGLLGRRIYHLPFSRALKLDSDQVHAIGNMCMECMENRGILLVQNEHLISLQLMCLDAIIAGSQLLGESLLGIHHFLNAHSRDIVDESDENFSVKFELIYPMGLQRPTELSPERWTIVQKILEMVLNIALEVQQALPSSVEVGDKSRGRYPQIRILCADAQDAILECLARTICQDDLPGFPASRWSSQLREAVFDYISKRHVTKEQASMVENSHTFCAKSTLSTLLLVRGLIAGGVLAFALTSKRWRVNFGLDLYRKPETDLAVPYRAKDDPTLRSEFSHVEVVILMTLLSYYYGGLSDDNLFTALAYLFRSKQAQTQYAEWVRTAPNLPSTFHQLIGINIEDQVQCVEGFFPYIRYSKGAIDYYLSQVVFPKQMREFPQKLTASGWDIAREKTYPTTGFSGTNDSRYLLPLGIEYVHLEEQKHTNSLVLEHLLHEDNTVLLLPGRNNHNGNAARQLLQVVTELNPAVRVIIDVGAQVLELSNEEVAREWLNMVAPNESTQAAIFFTNEDELFVLDRKGDKELLQTSPYSRKMEACLAFPRRGTCARD